MPYYPERKPAEPAGGKEPERDPEKRRRLFRLALVVVSCLLAGYGSARLIIYLGELNASRNTSAELRQIHEEAETAAPAPETENIAAVSPVPDPVISPSPESPAPERVRSGETLPPMPYPNGPAASDRFRGLRKKSEYIIGWIHFDDIDEPVVQKDNTFFLNHDALGKKNSNGAIFLDSEIYLSTRPYTLILYGHNMKSGNMFGKLKKYRDSAYFFRNRIITFDSLYEEGQYAVFSVMDMNTVPGTALWFDLWSLNSPRADVREKAIRTAEERSAVRCTLDVRADEQLLVLVTCLDGDTERLLVVARRLREDETPESLVIR